jgi:hypothetical protein
MIVRIITLLVICLLSVNCTTNLQEPTDGIHIRNLLDEAQSVELTKQHIGFWVNEDYIKLLEESKSTKIAGSKSVDDFYRIRGDNSIRQMNIHEGAGLNVLSLKTEGSGAIYSSDSTRLIAEVSFEGDTLTVNDNRYFHILNGDSALDKLVNERVISGQYFLKESSVEFKSNGSITGMKGVQSYRLNLDYGAPGMEFDIIYLLMDSESIPKAHLYDIEQDSVFIFEIDCQYEESGECMEVAKGVKVFSFYKNSSTIPPVMAGVWVIEEYILDIIKTKSPLKSSKYLKGACSIVIDSVLNADSISAGVSWNNHEGTNLTIYNEAGQNNRFYKTNLLDYENKENLFELGYEISDADTQLVLLKCGIKHQIISTRKYVKIAKSQNSDDLGWGLEQAVNQVMIAGQRSIIDSSGVSIEVIFTKDGEIKGHSDFDGFYIFTDFMGGPITVLDGICLKRGDESSCYAFKSSGDTISLYSTKGESEAGEQEELDKLVYRICNYKML